MTTKHRPGETGYITRKLGYCTQSAEDTDLAFPGVSRARRSLDISPPGWLIHTLPAMVSAHFNVAVQQLAHFPHGVPGNLPL